MTLEWVAHDQRTRYVCSACRTIHYQNPLVVVGSIVCWEGRVLMCRRAEEPERGKWSIPSGFLERGETLEQGAAREVYEETGVSLDPGKLDLYSVINMPAVHQIAITFRIALSERPVLRCGAECTAVDFIGAADLSLEDYAWLDSVGDIRHKFYSEVASQRFGISLMSLGSNCGAGLRVREYRIASADGA